jgi:anti-sigma-K factor RskA
MRIRAMIAALPFETPKLAVTATVSENDFATLLDRRLKRIEEMKAEAIEATPQVEVACWSERGTLYRVLEVPRSLTQRSLV